MTKLNQSYQTQLGHATTPFPSRTACVTLRSVFHNFSTSLTHPNDRESDHLSYSYGCNEACGILPRTDIESSCSLEMLIGCSGSPDCSSTRSTSARAALRASGELPGRSTPSSEFRVQSSEFRVQRDNNHTQGSSDTEQTHSQFKEIRIIHKEVQTPNKHTHSQHTPPYQGDDITSKPFRLTYFQLKLTNDFLILCNLILSSDKLNKSGAPPNTCLILQFDTEMLLYFSTLDLDIRFGSPAIHLTPVVFQRIPTVVFRTVEQLSVCLSSRAMTNSHCIFLPLLSFSFDLMLSVSSLPP